MNAIVQLLGAKVFSTGPVKALIAALQGRETPAPWLSHIAKSILSTEGDSASLGAILELGLSFARENGLNDSDIISKVKMLGMFTDIQAPSDVAGLPEFILGLAKQIDDAPNFNNVGIVVCPSCGFTHLV